MNKVRENTAKPLTDQINTLTAEVATLKGRLGSDVETVKATVSSEKDKAVAAAERRGDLRVALVAGGVDANALDQLVKLDDPELSVEQSIQRMKDSGFGPLFGSRSAPDISTVPPQAEALGSEHEIGSPAWQQEEIDQLPQVRGMRGMEPDPSALRAWFRENAENINKWRAKNAMGDTSFHPKRTFVQQDDRRRGK